MVSKDVPFKWTKENSKAVEEIFDYIKTKSRLYYSDSNKPFDIYTDASDLGIGAVLVQDNKLVGTFSRKLNSA
ncbi:hypothetical protein A0H76_943 [Hepatospora eriocheir]|uniref:Reverse transcriptase/retrotransposon-derived protein RNase H-like domain-containing protein n=1 Tax=Hepatospora eriocheir TaxID=1081669 RepID=A0A1X0QI25_9MICR|nr:hypothetical protein A0H76_943 [Hepatospora eriocheir]